MSVSDETRFRWFDLGADAFRRQRPEEASILTESMYVCPLCVEAYRRAAVLPRLLSAEHVPPDWFGGTELVLTCRKCNNTDGSLLDADAERRDRIDAFVEGRRDGAIKNTRLMIGGASVNAQIDATDGTFTATLPERINRPGASDQLRGRKRGETVTVEFSGDKYSDLAANICWLRCGYLVLFAAFGYSLALDGAMDVVRRQIRNVEGGRLITTCLVIGPVWAPSTLRIFARMTEPDDLACWLVQFGRYRVLLPLAGDTSFYDRLANASDGGMAVPQTGEVCDWPTEPTFGL